MTAATGSPPTSVASSTSSCEALRSWRVVIVSSQPWPGAPGEQQMTAHLDIAVDDLDAAGAHAEAAGAVLAEFQPQEDVRVYLDPAGHPFCLYLPE